MPESSWEGDDERNNDNSVDEKPLLVREKTNSTTVSHIGDLFDDEENNSALLVLSAAAEDSPLLLPGENEGSTTAGTSSSSVKKQWSVFRWFKVVMKKCLWLNNHNRSNKDIV